MNSDDEVTMIMIMIHERLLTPSIGHHSNLLNSFGDEGLLSLFSYIFSLN